MKDVWLYPLQADFREALGRPMKLLTREELLPPAHSHRPESLVDIILASQERLVQAGTASQGVGSPTGPK